MDEQTINEWWANLPIEKKKLIYFEGKQETIYLLYLDLKDGTGYKVAVESFNRERLIQYHNSFLTKVPTEFEKGSPLEDYRPCVNPDFKQLDGHHGSGIQALKTDPDSKTSNLRI